MAGFRTQAGAFDAVLVYDPDRLSRKYVYQFLIMEELERLGVQMIFLKQPPPDDPKSVLLVQIQGAVAEYERVKIVERYRRGKLYRARQGEVFWNTPFPTATVVFPVKTGLRRTSLWRTPRPTWSDTSSHGTPMKT